MTTHEINLLIERYLDGETTPAEEHQLALAVQREDRPAEWAIIAEMLGELTRDEAMWTQPQSQRTLQTHHTLQTHPLTPPCEGGERSLSTIYGLSEKEVSAPLHLDFCPSITRGARGEWGKGWVRRGWVWWVRWAAAACIAIVFGLSYYIIKEEQQELAKVELPLPAITQQEQKPVLVARVEQPSHELQHEHVSTIQPLVRHNKLKLQIEQPLIEEQASEREPQPKVEPQLIAEAQESTPPPEDLALCMALLAEVEARAFMLEESLQTHPQPLPNGRGEVTTPAIYISENEVSTPLPLGEGLGVGLLGPEGPIDLLLDELLAYIQQQSNRPELSL